MTNPTKHERTEPVPTFNALDFIADLLYHTQCHREKMHGVRWWCHGARGGRRKWRKKAREAIEQWAKAERETMANQARHPLEFFK